METQMTVNLLNSSENEYSKFTTTKMIRYRQCIERGLFASRPNKCFNKVNMIKSL